MRYPLLSIEANKDEASELKLPSPRSSHSSKANNPFSGALFCLYVNTDEGHSFARRYTKLTTCSATTYVLLDIISHLHNANFASSRRKTTRPCSKPHRPLYRKGPIPPQLWAISTLLPSKIHPTILRLERRAHDLYPARRRSPSHLLPKISHRSRIHYGCRHYGRRLSYTQRPFRDRLQPPLCSAQQPYSREDVRRRRHPGAIHNGAL